MNEDEEPTDKTDKDADYNYLLSMPFWNLSQEKKEDMLRNRDKKLEELEEIQATSHEELWLRDLDAFLEELERVEQKERDEEMVGHIRTGKPKGELLIYGTITV